MYRTFVILRHTFIESVLQPIYALLLAIGAAIIVIFALLPYFTLGEDSKMFTAGTLDLSLTLILITALFATSKSIFEEIEDRTMLTLMSKPVQKWEVLVGKYLGIVLASGMAVAILGIVTVLALWYRIPGDYQLRVNSINLSDVALLRNYRLAHIAGAIPSLFLIWLQICVLAAIGVALSTRAALVVNLPVVILLYIGGNLMRGLFPLSQGPLRDSGWLAQKSAYLLSIVLPYLQTFDLRDKTVYARIGVPGTEFAIDPSAIPLWEILRDTGMAGIYAVSYVAFALAVGMLLFQNRELGGAEG